MRMQSILLAAVFLLGGCVEDDPSSAEPDGTETDTGSSGTTSGTSSSSTSSSSTTSTTSTTTTAAPPPVLEGTLSADTTEGSVPLVVSFQLAAKNATDTLTWAFDTDGDGNPDEEGAAVDLPKDIQATYGEVGSFAAKATFTDGERVVYANLTITVIEPLPIHTVTGTTTVTGNPFTSGVVVSDVDGLGAKGCAGFLQGENEQDCVFGSLPDAAHGRPYVFSGTASQPYVEFLDSCEPTADVVAQYSNAEGGAVPASAGCAVMWFFSNATGTLTLDIF